jgi:transposase
MDPVAAIIEGWLRTDQKMPKRQRHTAHRVWKRLVDEHGFRGAESTVRKWVRQWKAAHGKGDCKAVIPLDPEVSQEAEVDWGTARVWMAGQLRQIKLFVMRSRYSGKPFVRAYPWERQQMFFDAHMRAFAYYGGVFRQLVYDNLSVAVARILRGKKRVEQDRFVSFRSHYTFSARFCSPAVAREKGGVEGLIGFARRNFLVPVPKVDNFEQLNEWLLEKCLEYGGHRLRGREDERTVQQRFETEQKNLLRLPDEPFVNETAVKVKVDRYRTVQVDRNRYSVPAGWVGRWIWAHVGCWKITLYGEHRELATHERVFSHSKWQIDPQHYLDLLARRPGAFDSARAIVGWKQQWPETYPRLLSQLRQRQGDSRGTREFIEILKLHARYRAEQVEAAVGQAMRSQCAGLQTVRQLLHYQESPAVQVEPLPAELIPGITDRQVTSSDVSRYGQLQGGDR